MGGDSKFAKMHPSTGMVIMLRGLTMKDYTVLPCEPGFGHLSRPFHFVPRVPNTLLSPHIRTSIGLLQRMRECMRIQDKDESSAQKS